MDRRRIIVGQDEWAFDDPEAIVFAVREAMANGTVAELPVLDNAGRPLTVYFDGKTASTVVVDLDLDPRPSEISG